MCIFFNKSFTHEIVNYVELIPGRLQAVDIKLDDKLLKVINIYGPNNDDKSLFEQLLQYIIDNEDSDFIIGGDFNTVLNTDKDKRITEGQIHIKHVVIK